MSLPSIDLLGRIANLEASVYGGPNPAGQSVQSLTPNVSLVVASQPTVRLIDSELTLGYEGSTTVSGSAAAIRGNLTVGSGTTITGASYLYGTQGKLTIKGTHSGSAEVSCGLLGQLDLSSAKGVTAPVACIWGDCGASVGTATGSNIDALVLYNTIAGLTINSALRVYAYASYFADLSDASSGWIVGTAKSSGWDKSLKIKLNGTTYYIPCNSAAS